MIDASDLTTAEVRAQYVSPLIHEILQKSNLMDHAPSLLDNPTTSPTSSGADASTRTLFEEIASEYPSANATDEPNPSRCYAEVSVDRDI